MSRKNGAYVTNAIEENIQLTWRERRFRISSRTAVTRAGSCRIAVIVIRIVGELEIPRNESGESFAFRVCFEN